LTASRDGDTDRGSGKRRFEIPIRIPGAAHNGDFSKFNPEEQAQIVEDFWRATREGATDTLPVKDLRPYARTVFTPLHTTRARAVVRGARAGMHSANRIQTQAGAYYPAARSSMTLTVNWDALRRAPGLRIVIPGQLRTRSEG
jgi:hypothetical protein